MEWIRADYEFGSLFSYRIPDYPSPSYALSSPLPGPSTIKLAIVATAIETSGKIDFGEEVFETVKNAWIKIKSPQKIALSNLLIKRLKQRDPSKQKTNIIGDCEECGKKNVKLWLIEGKNICKECATVLESTFGIRGYVHFQEPLTIYLYVDNKDVIKELLQKIRQFGTSDSLVYCKNVAEEEPSANCIEPVGTLEKAQRNVLLVPVKDLNPDKEINFDDVNPYVKSSRGKDVFVKRFYLLPISKQIQGKNWVVYELG
jgi:CRISPR-associated Cas5-like protein